MSRRTRDEDFDTKIDILRTRLKDSDDKNVQDAVFDKRTLMDLYGLASKGVIDALGGSVCTGKEANIFRARAGEKELALKIYRISTSNFNSMQDYLQGDPRFSSVRGTKRAIVAAWAPSHSHEREYPGHGSRCRGWPGCSNLKRSGPKAGGSKSRL